MSSLVFVAHLRIFLKLMELCDVALPNALSKKHQIWTFDDGQPSRQLNVELTDRKIRIPDLNIFYAIQFRKLSILMRQKSPNVRIERI